MATSQSGNSAHDAAVDAAESTRQVAVAAAANQAAATAAEVTFYRACLASALAHGIANLAPFYSSALLALGTGGR